MPKPKLIVIAGPTAVGKTGFSIDLADKLGTEVVSADARQVFREMNIGTAKPTLAEIGEVPHHFISARSIFEPYGVGDFEQESLLLLNQLFERKNVAVMAGGSGLYVRAVCDGLDEMPASSPEIREQLLSRLELEGLKSLVEELKIKDPEFARIVDVHNPQRVVRALEVCIGTGKPFSSFRSGKKTTRPFDSIKIGLERDRAELYSRIDSRVDQMLEQGLIEEARNLFPHRELNALQTVGYSELFGYFADDYDLEEAIRLLKRNSRRYAKRQLTWFKKDPEFNWFPANNPEKILEYIYQQLMK